LLWLIGGVAGVPPRPPWAIDSPEKPMQTIPKINALDLPWDQHVIRIDLSSPTPVTLFCELNKCIIYDHR
jgi:hypothetical protein